MSAATAATTASVVTAGTALAGIGSSVMAYQGQKNQAKFAEQSATVERNANVARLGFEQSQETQNQADRLEGLRRETEAKQATARAAAADAGVEGISVDSVLNELSGQGAEALQTLNTNYARTGVANATERTNIDQQYSRTVASSPRPSGLGLALDLVSQGAKGYAGYKGSQLEIKRSQVDTKRTGGAS